MIKGFVYRVQCPYNSNKVWLVKKYKNDNHYYLNQEVCGRIFYKKYVRVSKSWINEIMK